MKDIILAIFFFFIFIIVSFSQDLKDERSFHQSVLSVIKNKIEDNYFDPKFGGVNIDDKFRTAKEELNNASSGAQMLNIISNFLYSFDDPHLFFLPPKTTTKIEYGWAMRFFGDKVFVTDVDEKSDAAKKGIKAGDQIYMIEGFIPSRKDFWKLRYQFEILNPQPSLEVILIKPSGNKYKVKLDANVTKEKLLYYYHDFDSRTFLIEEENILSEHTKQSTNNEMDELFIWKLSSFQINPTAMDKVMSQAKKAKSLIIDLRGNDSLTELHWTSIVRANRERNYIPSRNRRDSIEDMLNEDDGDLKMLGRMVGNFFDKEIKIGEWRSRNNTKQLTAKPRKEDFFPGKLVVLIDSETGAASEMFAKIIQLQKRGIVIGDKSSGMVMETKLIVPRVVTDLNMPFAMNITFADILMRDGNRLEKNGIIPDEKVVPTAADLAAKRDPVMARAAELLGYKITPENAGMVYEKK